MTRTSRPPGHAGGRAWTAEPHAWNTSAPARRFAARPRLCSFAAPAALETPTPAVLVVASDLAYLFRLWPYFLNKVLWAWANEHRFAVYVGALPNVVGQRYGSDCRASRQKMQFYHPPPQNASRRLAKSFYAGKERNSNHHNKMLAAYRGRAEVH